MNFTNKVYSKAFLYNTLEQILLLKLLSSVQLAMYTFMYFYTKYTWMNIT